jgi:hypothetical protein
MWRAATDLQAQLQDPRIGRILEASLTKSNSSEVSYVVARETSQLGSPTLALEIAKRAAVQSVGASDRTSAFVQNLFAEASNYIVSRDLPGNVGLGNRTVDVSQAVALKSDLVQRTKDAVSAIATARASARWSEVAGQIVKKLSERD